jgi:flagellar motor switch/type III secretory pathway protein FliN
MKILPLVGLKSLNAFNSFNLLLLGLKMLPLNLGKSYEEFYAEFDELEESAKEKFVRQAVAFVKMESEEIEDLLAFATDTNGCRFDKTNISNLSLAQINDIVVAVCMEIGRIKISLVTSEEKKTSVTGQST